MPGSASTQTPKEHFRRRLDASCQAIEEDHTNTTPVLTELRRKPLTDASASPSQLSAATLHILQTVFEQFASSFAAAMSHLLRTPVGVQLARINRMAYSQVIATSENPTWINLIQAKSLQEPLILEIPLLILEPIIDRLLGGAALQTDLGIRRSLTQIELRLVSRVSQLALQEIERSWRPICNLKPYVDTVISNPQQLRTASAQEPVVAIRFDLTVNKARGTMNVCLPSQAVERLVKGQNAGQNGAAVGTGTNSKNVGPSTEQPPDTLAEVVVHLAQTTLSTDDLRGLSVGDIITTESNIHTPINVSVGGLCSFRAFPGTHQGYKAIQIKVPIQPPTE